MGLQVLAQRQLLQHLLIPLKELDGVPPEIAVVHPALDGLLNVGDGVLHAAGKDMGQLLLLVLLGQLHRCMGGFQAALVLQGGHLHHLTAQRVPQLLQVDLVAVFADQVDHVHGHHHGQASSV